MKFIDYIIIAAVVAATVVGFAGYSLEAALLTFAIITVASWHFYDSSAWFAGPVKNPRSHQATNSCAAESAVRTDGHSLAQLPREELFAKAERTVQSTIERFPDELKGEAKKLPCLLKNWAEAKTSGSTLGHYIGFEIGRLSECNGPIILYLGAIQEYCTENGLDFEEEVRKTYLHEFGHHLGWDEGELEKRGLA